MIELKGKYSQAKIMIDEVEEQCINQLSLMLSHPAFTNPVVIMPDTHAGKGSVVGFTMALTEKIIPNVVGVDIGCGMLGINLENVDETKRKEIDHEIKRSIPTGTNTHKESQPTPTEWDALFNASTLTVEWFITKYNKVFGTDFSPIKYSMEWFDAKIKQIGLDPERAKNSIGTLGGGNHFIEIGKSDVKGYWLTIHSGSRKFGECVCRYHQLIAKENLEQKRTVLLQGKINEIMKKYANDHEKIQPAIEQTKKELGLDFSVDTKGMEFLEGQEAINYCIDMIFAQQYARLNRTIMAKIILENVFKGEKVIKSIDSVHNYIDFHDLTIRKGAIEAYEGDLSIIPFNMEDGLLIVEGKSNPEWNCSAPHGAGRLMSRTKAKEVLSLEEMKQGMEAADVYSTSLNKHTIDEAKGAYKSSELIEMLIEPTAKIVERVKPILNIKDASNDMSWKERRANKRKRDDRQSRELKDLSYKKMKKHK